MAKLFYIYYVTSGCEGITVWADKTKTNPDGKYELATASQDELKHLYEDLGNRREVYRSSYDKATYDKLMKEQKAAAEKKKKEEKGK